MFKKWCLKKNGGRGGKGLKVECHVSLRFCPLKGFKQFQMPSITG